MVVEAACDSKTFVGRNKALRAQASKAFPASAAILCRKRHHALRLDGLISAYGTEKYCSASIMLGKAGVEITHDYEVLAS